jgi:predicted amidophosphoribosyltransferase
MLYLFCAVCGAPRFHESPSVTLCHHCFKKYEERLPQYYTRDEDGVEHIYLLRWDSDTDIFCKSLVYVLKNKDSSHFAPFLQNLTPFLCQDPYRLAVVPAGSSKWRKNHATEFASCLEKLLSINCVIEMRRDKGAPQKSKTRFERLQSSCTDMRKSFFDSEWVFVDDVFVTGGTYKKALRFAGKKPEAIFTLIYKPLEHEDWEI